MKIRDLFAVINGSTEITELPSGGLDIIADDGRTLFSLTLKGNVLSIDGGNVCKHDGILLDNSFVIKPKAANCVDLIKYEYENVK